MIVKTQSRNDLGRISKRPSPESINGFWILCVCVLLCFGFCLSVFKEIVI